MATISKMELLLCQSQRRTIFVCIAPVVLARPKIVLKQNVRFQHARITNLFLGNAVLIHVLQVKRNTNCRDQTILYPGSLFRNASVNYFRENPIGQLFLGGRGYSSGTIKLAVRLSRFLFLLAQTL